MQNYKGLYKTFGVKFLNFEQALIPIAPPPEEYLVVYP